MKMCGRLILIALVLFFLGSPILSARDDVLQIYTAYDATEVKIFMEAFRRETKINVEWTKLPAGDILSRLTAEAKNPKATVWFGGPNLDFIAARKAGLLTPYHSRTGNFLKAG